MYFSIINILNKDLYKYSNVYIEVQVNGRVVRNLHSGFSNQFGQVFINHDYCGLVEILINGIFHKAVEFPGITTIIITDNQKLTWNQI